MATTTGTAASALPATGGTSTQGLADWAAPYVTDYLGKAQALANTPYQTYQGPLTAGPSALQTQAFQGIGSLTVPTAISDATARAAKLANVDIPAYTPTTLGGTFNAPAAYQTSNITSGFNAPAPYQTQQFQNPFTAPAAYTTANYTNPFAAPEKYQASTFESAYEAPQNYIPVGGSITDADIAGKYMNPYLKEALEPTLDEIRRQSQISQLGNAARMVGAGAYGGSRQAIMDAESQRNLLQQLAKTTGEGYSTAYDKALAQYNAEQARKIQEAQFGSQLGLSSADVAAKYRLAAQQAAEQSKQFGAQQGLSAADIAAKYNLATQQAQEQSRQFGAQQGLSAADIAAKYGLATQQAIEQSRQFGAQQGLTSAQIAAQLGLEAQRINEQSRQFGAGQALTSAQIAAQNAMEAQKATEASRQFGAGYGLDALSKQIAATQTLGNLGLTGLQAQKDILGQQLSAGATQQAIDQAGIAADLAEFNAQREFPYKQLQFQRDMISGLPTSSVTNTPAQLSGIAQLISAVGGIDKLLQSTGQGSLGDLMGNLGFNFGGSESV